MALVDTETLDVYYYYYTSGGIPSDVNDHCVRVPVPQDLDYTVTKAAKADDGTISIVNDPIKLSAKLWDQVRTERNSRLAACDWTQLADAHLSAEKKEAWADYRQALRDLPEETTDPAQVQWPLDPTQIPFVPASGTRVDNLMGLA